MVLVDTETGQGLMGRRRTNETDGRLRALQVSGVAKLHYT